MSERPPPLVLVVEGVVTVREDLVGLLGNRGYRVVGAGDGEAALALVVDDVPDAILLDHQLPGMSGIEVLERLRADDRLAAVPVIMLTQDFDRDTLIGALRSGAHDYLLNPFDPAELDARVIAALRVNARHEALLDANRRLVAQALTDDLTGLANRRNGALALERTVALATRRAHVLALARVDIDHFDQIDDTRGRQAGDRVVAEVARRLAAALRGGDELARWGGPEFIVILPDTDRAGALRAAERLRAAVAGAPVDVEGGQVEVTISVGWAHWAGDTPDDLVARADRALDQAKNAGPGAVWPEQ